MPLPVYSLRRFEVLTALVGRGNQLADLLTQFFAINPTVTIVNAGINWREGRSRSDTYTFTLLYRGGGTPGRFWASQFQSTPSTTAEALAEAFFAANPSYTAVRTVVLSRPDITPRNRRLLVIYATTQQVQ